jgi:hypothetical protein
MKGGLKRTADKRPKRRHRVYIVRYDGVSVILHACKLKLASCGWIGVAWQVDSRGGVSLGRSRGCTRRLPAFMPLGRGIEMGACLLLHLRLSHIDDGACAFLSLELDSCLPAT